MNKYVESVEVELESATDNIKNTFLDHVDTMDLESTILDFPDPDLSCFDHHTEKRCNGESCVWCLCDICSTPAAGICMPVVAYLVVYRECTCTYNFEEEALELALNSVSEVAVVADKLPNPPPDLVPDVDSVKP